jgi:nucleoside-diphosphate-sugar epimerase
MRVLVAGATGVIGRALVPLLVAAGHDAVGLSRSRDRAAALELTGARLVQADALDPDSVRRAVGGTAPDAVVNLLTAIPAVINPRRMARDFAMTNRLRTEGTRNLLAAADAAGVKRIISEGLAYVYEPDDGGPADEDQPFWAPPPRAFAPVLAAVRELETQTTERGGLVLRIGHLYGSGTIYAPDGSFVRQVLAGKMPLVGAASATFSFTHTYDAGTAIVAALDRNVPGVLNVVGDDPAPVSQWLPELARILGAPPPRSVPAALARLAVGSFGVAWMTQLRGADNGRARTALGWYPRHASWRDGFAAELSSDAVRAA